MRRERREVEKGRRAVQRLGGRRRELLQKADDLHLSTSLLPLLIPNVIPSTFYITTFYFHIFSLFIMSQHALSDDQVSHLVIPLPFHNPARTSSEADPVVLIYPPI